MASNSSKSNLELYDTSLPFYTIRPDYIKDEINEEDIRFIIWNTLEKAPYKHLYINPMDRNIEETAHLFFRILDEEYETLPPMPRYRSSLWISKQKRTQTINYAGCSDILISQNHLYKNILHRLQKPTNSSFHRGPLACFFMNGIDLLTNGETECWEEIEGLYPAIPEISDEMKERNHHTYQLFTQGTNGARIVYHESYKEHTHSSLPKSLQ